MLYLIITEPFLSLHFPVTPESHLFDAATPTPLSQNSIRFATPIITTSLSSPAKSLNTPGIRALPCLSISQSAAPAVKNLTSFLDSMLQGEKDSYVYVQVTPDIFVRTPVKVEATKDGFAVINDGLHPGDKVISEGGYYLK